MDTRDTDLCFPIGILGNPEPGKSSPSAIQSLLANSTPSRLVLSSGGMSNSFQHHRRRRSNGSVAMLGGAMEGDAGQEVVVVPESGSLIGNSAQVSDTPGTHLRADGDIVLDMSPVDAEIERIGNGYFQWMVRIMVLFYLSSQECELCLCSHTGHTKHFSNSGLFVARLWHFWAWATRPMPWSCWPSLTSCLSCLILTQHKKVRLLGRQLLIGLC